MMQDLTWTSLAPGVWRARLGTPSPITPMTLTAAPPRAELPRIPPGYAHAGVFFRALRPNG